MAPAGGGEGTLDLKWQEWLSKNESWAPQNNLG